MIPDKLKPGDEVRVIAPARSASDINERVLDWAKAALESLGLKVTFSKNAFLEISEAARRTTRRLQIYTKRLWTKT